jgi:hypothetical protein
MDKLKLSTPIRSFQCVHNCVAFPTCHQVVSRKTKIFLLLKLVPERTLLQLLMKATAYIRVDADICLHMCRCRHLYTYVLAQGGLKGIILDGYLIKLLILCRAIWLNLKLCKHETSSSNLCYMIVRGNKPNTGDQMAKHVLYNCIIYYFVTCFIIASHGSVCWKKAGHYG